jgi:hypothetical protein
MGAAAGAATGAAVDQNSKLKQENAGMGILDLLMGSVTSGKSFFEQVNSQMDQRAKAEAEARSRDASQSKQIQQQMLEQLTIIAGKPTPPGAAPGGQVSN